MIPCYTCLAQSTLASPIGHQSIDLAQRRAAHCRGLFREWKRDVDDV
jgi:hypothetical protein